VKVGARESLTDKAYKQLEEMIVTLQLEPGSVLAEADLGQRLHIGRTPIREALHRLAREGLVTILPRKGILVTEINPGKQFLVLELRRELEFALSELGETRREVVLLHDLEGWKHRDIAEALEISEGMSRQHLMVARRTLRERLGMEFLKEHAHD